MLQQKPLKAILFDLDGTLIQVEMLDFIPVYLEQLARHFRDLTSPARFGRVMRKAIGGLLAGSDGQLSNQIVLETALERHLGVAPDSCRNRFAAFVDDGLQELAALVKPHPLSRTILESSFESGLEVIIATNPIFPLEVVLARLRWGGLADLPYRLVTSYETCRYCKPQPEYFVDILDTLGFTAGQCLMVGNDTGHDLAARKAGIPTFLLETWLIDRCAGRFQSDYRGRHEELLALVDSLTVGKALDYCREELKNPEKY